VATLIGEGLQRQHAEPSKDRASHEARRLFADLMAVSPDLRREFYRPLMGTRDMDALLRVSAYESGSPYGLWVDDPVGFTEDVLQETTWSKQREVLQSIMLSKRVAVPSAFGTGKTHLAARAALWRSLVHPPGTSLTVTTATRYRQVIRQLWPHIRQSVTKAGLPLIADQAQLKAYDTNGTEVVVAYGFSAPAHDEAAVQGIHAPRLFIVVDEAGGISRIIGSAMRGLLTGDDTRLLAIGNPPTDDEGSWFENLCYPKELSAEAKVRTIPISAYSAPLQTGEKTRQCYACPPTVPPHRLGIHLVGPDWIEETLADYGSDAPFVTAKVHARFPRGGPSRIIPADWVDLANDADDPALDEAHVLLSSIHNDEAKYPYVVAHGSWVRLGVDVASDGGDEFVIARAIGDLGHVVHSSTGSANTNAMDVAGKVLEQIQRADRIRKALGVTAPVRVKVDGIGVGWGVVSTLRAWGSEGLHTAQIVDVDVAEGTYRPDADLTMKPNRKRDEMWLTMRELLQPSQDGAGALRLKIESRAKGQLSAPTYSTTSGGKTVVESKKSMRARGMNSPDQAEALLLAFYEPELKEKKGTFGVLA
jgi:hypothetical protein